MTYFIASGCIDVLDKSCVGECPVDCIYEGERKLYINPAECIDCGACEPVCPEEAIYDDRRPPAEVTGFLEEDRRFFEETLPGRPGPIGSPGGSDNLGPAGADTPLVHSWPRRGAGTAVSAAIRLVKTAGADLVKIDGAADYPEAVSAVARAGIPVWAQFGITPQTLLRYGLDYAAMMAPGAEVPAEMKDGLVANAKRLEDAGGTWSRRCTWRMPPVTGYSAAGYSPL